MKDVVRSPRSFAFSFMGAIVHSRHETFGIRVRRIDKVSDSAVKRLGYLLRR